MDFKRMMIGFLSGAVVVSLLATPSVAGLTENVLTDTETNLDVIWSWNPEEEDSSYLPVLSNWGNFGLSIGSPVEGTWELNLDVRHVTDPHPEDDGGGAQSGFWFMFDDATDFGLIFDDQDIVDHDPVSAGHYDVYEFSFDRSANSANTVIHLTGTHIPEPASLGLLLIGATVALSRRRTKS